MTQTTQIPKFNYTCGKVDICELAFAIERSSEIEQSKRVSQFFRAMFNISNDEYSKAQREIQKRVKGKNRFTGRLSDLIAKLQPPKKRHKPPLVKN